MNTPLNLEYGSPVIHRVPAFGHDLRMSRPMAGCCHALRQVQDVYSSSSSAGIDICNEIFVALTCGFRDYLICRYFLSTYIPLLGMHHAPVLLPRFSLSRPKYLSYAVNLQPRFRVSGFGFMPHSIGETPLILTPCGHRDMFRWNAGT